MFFEFEEKIDFSDVTSSEELKTLANELVMRLSPEEVIGKVGLLNIKMSSVVPVEYEVPQTIIYESPDTRGTRSETYGSYGVTWSRKAGDVTEVSSRVTVRDLLIGGVLTVPGKFGFRTVEVRYGPVAKQLGATKDQLASFKKSLVVQAEVALKSLQEEYQRVVESTPLRVYPFSLQQEIVGYGEYASPSLWAMRKLMGEIASFAPTAEKKLAEEKAENKLFSFGGWTGTRGKTGRARYWIIRPDGSPREFDVETEKDRSNYVYWTVVEGDEVALKWSKGCATDAHHCEVVKAPYNYTHDQLEAIGRLEDELEKTWEGARGFSSGLPSPLIGNGWEIPGCPRKYFASQKEVKAVTPDVPADTRSGLNSLSDLFGEITPNRR